MKKAKNLLYTLDGVLLIIFCVLSFKLTDSFEYPRQEHYVEYLLDLRRIIAVAFVICVITTVAVKWICDDIKEELLYLNSRISELEKKVENE